ncbi:hypothetical protein [Tsukamurella sp. PLM1]|uniref:hypothetical protein n=1 Tax=Tsukamurella sp. PLM1 TaxID=2929795 RepID=UPI0020BE0202|nr:hypothetical protein [Tsukamurella sp. PLM1]
MTFVQRGWVYHAGGKNFDGFANGALLEAKDGYTSVIEGGQFKPYITSTPSDIVAEARIAGKLGYPLHVYTSTAEGRDAFSHALNGVTGVAKQVIFAPKGRVTF